MSPCLPGCARAWKGKGRATPELFRRDAGDGGDDGIVLPLKMLVASAYEAVYTLPVLVGSSGQNLSLQVDTGSSDLWIASTSCGTQACKQAGGQLYDSSHSAPTGQTFKIGYVEGEVNGPIVWDRINVGGYVIDNQALAAATTVDDEPLSGDFSGILGLALPQNSIISEEIPPVTGNQPDGAVFASNLFTMTPSSSAPSSRFLSLTLARPESDKIPSLLGIGMHPKEVISDPSKVEYDGIVSDSSSSGPYFWEAEVKQLSVWVNGVQKIVDLGPSSANPDGIPTAVVDSGMPIILASANIANGIYGALGIGPANDGNYYVPCTTPINMSVVLDNRTAIALHPLDLTTPTSGSSCLGLIQSYPFGSTISTIADIILGVPFMRSTYTVMAYDPPDFKGNFPNASQSPASLNNIRPRLGLLGLTNPSVALDEFHTVRVLNEPLPITNSGAPTQHADQLAVSGKKKLSVGVEVLIGLLGFFALCFILFVARWAYHRRQVSRMKGLGATTSGSMGSLESKERDEYMMHEAAIRLARQSTLSRYGPSEDTMRQRKYDDYVRSRSSRSEVQSVYTDDTTRTRVADAEDKGKTNGVKAVDLDADEHDDDEGINEKPLNDRELGYRKVRNSIYDMDSFGDNRYPRMRDSATWADPRATLVDGRTVDLTSPIMHSDIELDEEGEHHRMEYPPSPSHTRINSAEAASVAVPLLAHTRHDSHDSIGASRRVPLGVSASRPSSHARVGSADSRRGRLSSAGFAPDFMNEPDRRVSTPSMRPSMIARPLSRASSGTGSPHLPSQALVDTELPMSPPPPLLNLSSNDPSQVSLSAEATNGHGS